VAYQSNCFFDVLLQLMFHTFNMPKFTVDSPLSNSLTNLLKVTFQEMANRRKVLEVRQILNFFGWISSQHNDPSEILETIITTLNQEMRTKVLQESFGILTEIGDTFSITVSTLTSNSLQEAFKKMTYKVFTIPDVVTIHLNRT
jgi:hypothetical protein